MLKRQDFTTHATKESMVRTVNWITRESRDHKTANTNNGQQYISQVVRKSPLCKNNTTITIFGTMRSDVIRQFFAHNKEVKNCRLPDDTTTCLFTSDSQYYHVADVLYIRPCFKKSNVYTKPAYPGQLVVIYNRAPEKKACSNPKKIKMTFDIRVSYTLSSTIAFPYMCWPHIQQPLLDALKLEPPAGRQGIVMFVSDCKATWRYKYLKELMKYIHIDSYGECLHNTNMKSSRNKGTDSFLQIKLDMIKSKRYKFLISFENTVITEYVTEKIWDAYMSQTIPIYYGAPEVYDQVPGSNTFIDASKFPRPKELAEYINKVDQNESLYKSYFNFDIKRTINFQKNCPTEPVGCVMCKQLYHLREQRCRQ